MEVRLDTLLVKPNDFKICQDCGVVNWYENECCWHCGCEKFKPEGEGIIGHYEDEKVFWTAEEGLTSEEADGVFIRVK